MATEDLVSTLLNDLDRSAREFEADAIDEKDDGNIRAATYHEGVARGLELASMKIRRLTGEMRRALGGGQAASRGRPRKRQRSPR